MLKLTDPNNPQFAGFPATVELAASNWANIFQLYVAELANPPPPTGSLAATAGRPLAETAFVAAVQSGDNPLDAILQQYVLQVVPNTNPLAGIATPPPGDPPIAVALAPFITAPTNDPTGPAAALAAGVQAYMLTGTFTPQGSPTPTPWS